MSKKVAVLVAGTRHEYQRHQDTMPAREKIRAELDQRLRQIIRERKIDLVVEEAGDDKTVWEHLRKDEPPKEICEAFFGEGSSTVDHPVPTIAKTIADEFCVRHEDMDTDVRADENDAESVQKRDESMTEKFLKVLGNRENVLVIVGDAHRASIAERLEKQGFLVETLPL